MAKCFVTTLADGRLAITRIAEGVDEARALAKTLVAIGGITPFQQMDDADLPPDRTYRDAWERQGATVGINAGKKQAIDNRRLARAAEVETFRTGTTDEKLTILGRRVGLSP